MKSVLIILGFISLVFADGGNYRYKGVKAVDNQLYIKECGSCHFAFQPGLLPERSWIKLMGNLENHFGDDASLDSVEYNKILEYLTNHAADRAMEYKRSNRIVSSLWDSQTPIKITEIPYFVRKHDEIPQKMIIQKEVKTLSNCAACHSRASEGSYREREIKIPNYGRWDD